MNEAEIRAERTFLKVQILEVEHLKEMAGDHPLMSIALAERVQELREKFSALPPEAETIETPAV